MATERGTLEVVASTLAGLLQPLEERLRAGEVLFLLAELGLQFPDTVAANAPFTNAAKAVALRTTDMIRLAQELAAAVEAGDSGQILAKGVALAGAIKGVIEETNRLATALKTVGGGIPAAELQAFADALPRRLVDYLVVRNLETIPAVTELLEFIGVVDRTELPAVDPQHPAFVRRALDLNVIGAFAKDPAGHLLAKYQWGAPGFDGAVLLGTVRRLLSGAGLPAVLDTSGPLPVLDMLFLELQAKTDISPPGLVLTFADSIKIDAAVPYVQDDWRLRFVGSAAFDPGVQIVLSPDDGITLVPVTPARIEGDTFVEWTGGNSAGTPTVLVGEPGGSRLEARQLVVRAGVGLAWNAGTNQAEGVFKVRGDVKGGKLVVDLSNADGFIGSLLSGFGLETDFDMGIGYSSREGLFFTGAAGLEIQLPLHVQLGPVELSALTVSVGIAGSTFPVGLRANIKAALGPLQAVVEQIGIGADIALVGGAGGGNAGPVDFSLRFLPPKGVGLSIDLGVVKGGGYLFIDPERGEYAGALELALFEVVTIKAVGFIATKNPDGSPGFSLLILMSVEFGAGIQLGFGFTLLAVGGLLGLNRTMNLQALAEGVRSGAIESVMFPRDVIANAPRIISDLRAFFPPRANTFLIGPMVKLGWGTPTLVSLAMGIIIEIPGNIAIVGVLQVALPTRDAAVIKLQVNFIGAIEFDRQRLWFFAALFDSRVLFLTIEGEMGLLVAFGDDANFVVSVGGFHPRFSPPALPFPSPRRISLSLLSSPVARVRIEGYFAVTTNTVQFGARVELFFGLDILNVQGHLAFDALFQFSPFYFIIEISASFSVKVFGAGLFSVSLRGSLQGPAPWHIKGRGEISILFWDIDVEFDETWGEDRREELPAVAVLPLLAAELDKPDNWRAILPAGSNLLVTLRKMPEAEAALILHPVGVLRVAQRAMPLELKLDKIGSQKPADVNRVGLVVTAGDLARKADALELFAPAQYQDFTDADKLSRPAFAKERAGLDLSASGADLRSAVMVRRAVRYEEIIIDSNYKRFARRFRDYVGVLFNFFLAGSSASLSELSSASKKKLQPFDDRIEILPDTYAVAFQSTNQAYGAGTLHFASEAGAREFMRAEVANNPSLADAIHVIPTVEAAA
jgi:hypothetical protein